MSTSPASLVAVVVTYNRCGKLAACLDALLSHPAGELTAVVVIDNASTDGTAALLGEITDPRLQICRLSENRGGAGGFAEGFTYARDHLDPDWIVVMDDDAAPTPGTFTRFHATERDSADGWAAAVYLPSGAISEMNRPVRNPFNSPMVLLKTLIFGRDGFHTGAEAFASSETPEIDGASFVGLFLSRAAMQRGGVPDAGLFLYGDDTLYTLELTRAGGVMRFDPSLVFTHDCESVVEKTDVIRPFWRAYFYHRNLLIVYRAAAGPLFFPLVRWVKLRSWRKRAAAYGRESATFLDLLSRAAEDAALNRRDVTRAQIAAAFPGGAKG